MPHQCVHCGNIYPDAAPELLSGCSCGARFFYYIKQEKLEQIQKENKETSKIDILEKADKVQVEKDIREMTGLVEEPEKPVILDLESIKVIKPGKFEIDIVNLFSKKRPLIYKLEEGKYIIDLSSSLKVNEEEIKRKIKNPNAIAVEKKDSEDNVPEEDDEDVEENLEEEENDREDEEIEEKEDDREEEK